MKEIVVVAFCIAVAISIINGCSCGSEPRNRPRPQPVQNQPAPEPPPPPPPPTPEEELGIEPPGKLAASVEAWAASNELGEYFKQSRERLSRLHARLIEDYNVRKESELAPTDFTHETLRKYREAFDADSELRQFMVECYSRKEPRPLPKTIASCFATAADVREEVRKTLLEAPPEIERLSDELAALDAKMKSAGISTWLQEKELKDWRDLQIKVDYIASRAARANASAAALAANLAKALRASRGAEEVKALNDKAEQLKADLASFAARASQQREIVNGQILITEFAASCKEMADGVTAVPVAFARKKARQAEIKELVGRITTSRARGYSDLNDLAQQTAAVKSRSRSEGEKEAELGRRVQKLAGNYERVFGSSAIYRLKQSLPEPSARARIDAEIQSFKRAIHLREGADPAGVLADIESKAYQLADRMEEEAMLKRLDETLRTVQRLAARRR